MSGPSFKETFTQPVPIAPRLGIATCLICGAAVLILDPPSGPDAIDAATRHIQWHADDLFR